MKNITDQLTKMATELLNEDLELSTESINLITKIVSESITTTNDKWNNLFEMFQDMKTHASANGNAIIQNDNPKGLQMGYLCENTGKTWFIRIGDLKRSIDNPIDDKDIMLVELFKKSFSSANGKEELLKFINKTE